MRPHLGMALVGRCQNRPDQVSSALAAARSGIEHLRRGGRTVEAVLMTAGLHVVEGSYQEAAGVLERLSDEAPRGPTAWSVPIDPLFAPLLSKKEFRRCLHQLAARAL